MPPPTRALVVLEGEAYARGLAHGQSQRSRIRSFHSTLLTSTLVPYLNREHAQIAAVLPEYRKERYANGQFSHQVLLDAAKELERSIPFAYRDEMRGIADGAGLPYDDVLVLNTFVDTVLSVRAIAAALHLSDAPRLQEVEVAGLAQDGVDNDDDGEIDEAGEGTLSPWTPSPTAALREVPDGAQLRFLLQDPQGVDDATVRVTVNGRVFVSGDPALQIAPHPELADGRVVTLDVPAGLAEDGGLRVAIIAGDRSKITEPAPERARFMRGERVAFAVAGSNKAREEIANVGFDDGTQPTSVAFALRGPATADGAPLLAHSFALLDANTSHKHGAVFEHRTSEGSPFIAVGWAGIAWGFSGLNDRGVAVACNHSDTLDNAVLGRFLEQIADIDNAKLVPRGRPIGFALRRALERSGTTQEVVDELAATQHAFGWSCLVADDQGDLRAVEVDADVSGGGAAHSYAPDAAGAASVGGDDLRVAAHFHKNVADMYPLEVLGKRVSPQREWSSYYFRSLDVFFRLGHALKTSPPLDAAGAAALLSRPQLEDQRDSMNAVVLEPSARRLRVSQGAIPATSAGFETYVLGEEAR